MARTPKAKETKSEPGILPLPQPVIEHHGATIFKAMREWKSASKLPPALLITGTSGVGKREIGWFIAQWVLCERTGFAHAAGGIEDEGPDLFGGSMPAPSSAAPVSDEPLPCGECASCKRAIHANWVDFTEILPADEDGTGSLKIDQFRDLKASLGFGAHQGAYRIILIPNADRMTPQAANSMLKLLEEPPTGWIFMLTASDPTLVLPTVLSRCQQLRLKPFSAAELESVLGWAGAEKNKRALVAELAQGSWRKALSLLNEENWENRGAIVGLLDTPTASSAALVEWAAQDTRRFDLLMDQLEGLIADLVRWSAAVGEADPAAYAWRNTDARAALGKHATAAVRRFGSRDGARAFWLERAERVARARGESLAPLNRKLLIQDVLLPWLEAPRRG